MSLVAPVSLADDTANTVNVTATNAKGDKIEEMCGDPNCNKVVADSADCVLCDFCKKWFHLAYTKLDRNSFKFLSKTSHSIFWKCSHCLPLENLLQNNITSMFSDFEKTITSKIDKIETNISKKINLAYKVKVVPSANAESSTKHTIDPKTFPSNSVSTTSVIHKPEQRSISDKTVEFQADITTDDSCATTTFTNTAPAKQNEGYSSNVNRKIEEKICNHYKMGTCRHGASGKKLVNNKECMYSHPLTHLSTQSNFFIKLF